MQAANGDGVIYMLTGDKHAIQLVVGLHALRKVYQGPVTILAGDDRGWAIAEACRTDYLHRLAPLTTLRWNSPSGKRGTQYANKTMMGSLSHYERTIFLDADTLPVRDFSDLWPRGDEVVLTSFADWTTAGRKIAGRVNAWRQYAEPEVQHQLATPHPAINTGVLAWRRGIQAAGFFDSWRNMTNRNVSFICDEIAAQLIHTQHEHRILDQRWNASPIHTTAAQRNDVRIWHGHGWKFIKRDEGWAIWEPHYREVIRQNIANINTWAGGKDRKLEERLRSDDEEGTRA